MVEEHSGTHTGGAAGGDASRPWQTLSSGFEQARAREDSLDRLVEWPAQRALLGDVAGLTVLDAGCGNGAKIAQLAIEGARPSIGVDISGNFIEPPPGVELIEGDLSDLAAVSYRSDGLLASATSTSEGTTTYTYNTAGLLASVTDPAGKTTQFTTRADGRVTTTTDAAGATTSQVLDSLDRPTSSTDPLGNVTTRTLDARGKVTAITDPRANTTHYFYDPVGQLTKVTDPLGRESTYAYDPAGRPLARTDGRGVTITNSYDEHGRLAEVDSPDGGLSYGYDQYGRQASITDATSTTTFTYDEASRVIREHDSTTNIALEYEYDMLGRRTSLAVVRGTTTLAHTRYRLDEDDRVTEVIDSAGRNTLFDYDDRGLLARMTHGNGTETTYDYDERGQITGIKNLPTSMTDLDGQPDGPLQDSIDTLTEVQNLIDELAEPENFTALGAVGEDLQDLTTDLFTGTPSFGTLLQLIGNLATLTTTTAGALDEAVDPDTLDALQGTVAELGDLAESLSDSTQSDQLTDALEDLTDNVDALATTVTDLQNELVQITSLVGNVLRIVQALLGGGDLAAELETTLNATIALINGLGQDIANVQTTVETVRQTLIDVLGAAGGLQSEWTYERDDVGRVVKADRRFVATGNEILSFTNTYGYDAAGRLTSATTTDPAAAAFGNANYEYDAAGNRTKVSIAGLLPVNATFDAANQLTTSGADTFTYDGAGNLLSQTTTGVPGPGTTYTWDAFGRLATQTDALGTTTNTYDYAGRRATTTVDVAGPAPAETTRYAYSGWDLEHSEVPGESSSSTAYTVLDGQVLGLVRSSIHAYYHPDATGNVGEVSDALGNALYRNAYGPWGEQLSIPAPDIDLPTEDVTDFGYSGAWGVRANGDLLDMRNRAYDPSLGQFLSRDPLASLTMAPYAYGYGNPIGLIDPYGLCGLGSWSDAWSCVTGAGNAIGDAATSTWNATTNAVSSAWDWTVDNSGTLSAITGGAAIVSYALCGPTAGIGCTVGGALSLTSAGLAGLNAANTCFYKSGATGADCALSAVDLGLSVVGVRIPSKLVFSGKHVSKYRKDLSEGGWNMTFGIGSCAVSEAAYAATGAVATVNSTGCFTSLANPTFAGSK